MIMETQALIKIAPSSDTQLMAFYAEALNLKRFADARSILTNADLGPATNDLALIAQVMKGMESCRKEYLKPFQDHIKETNEAYKALMEPIEQADKITRDKILAFRAEQERRRREAEAIETEKLALARREAALKDGEITIDLTPLAKPEPVPDRVRTEMGSSGIRDRWVFEVVDFSILPDQYKMVDAVKLGKVVRAGIHTISGVKIWNEPILAVNIK